MNQTRALIHSSHGRIQKKLPHTAVNCNNRWVTSFKMATWWGNRASRCWEDCIRCSLYLEPTETGTRWKPIQRRPASISAHRQRMRTSKRRNLRPMYRHLKSKSNSNLWPILIRIRAYVEQLSQRIVVVVQQKKIKAGNWWKTGSSNLASDQGW